MQEWKLREKLSLWSRYLQAAIIVSDWEFVATAEKEIREVWEELGGSDYSAIYDKKENQVPSTRAQIIKNLNTKKEIPVKPVKALESELDRWD